MSVATYFDIMTSTIDSNPQWLQRLLESAIAERWCTRTNCGTCASEKLRQALGLLDKSSSSQIRFLPMTAQMAEAMIDGLRACAPQAGSSHQLEEGVRWVLYEVWRNFGDRYFLKLDGTWANEVLGRMRSHHQRRQEARRIHEARQGVKMRDWKE
jgi:hypothetical protein